ncbi:MAG: type I-U CRISPR-associated protein Cas5/Cas6 [Blastocatellia bacterium]|nr:type I-U CRISPR-associated protein Cas5/Cas6 [Blastocatellia bacterium]
MNIKSNGKQPHSIKVNVARFTLKSTTLPSIENALPFAELVRRALICLRADHPHSEVITGKRADGVPLEGHAHAHYFATDEDEDGRLDHITIVAQRGFDNEDVAALVKLSQVSSYDRRSKIEISLDGIGMKEQFAEVSIFKKSHKWHSFTPFSLPRFGSRGSGKQPRPRDLPEAQLKRELASRHLPQPLSIRLIDGYLAKCQLIKWSDFYCRRFNATEGHGLAGFEIEFPTAVSGPIAVGFACHFSLGLFLPIGEAKC